MSDDRYERGEKTRRTVLGDEHVNRSMNKRSPIDEDFQKYITEVAWGTVWSRPGLDLRTRHLITVAVLAALGREHELTIHLKANSNVGSTPQEVIETLLQVAAYAGIPAAYGGFRLAKEFYGDQFEEE